MSPYLESTHRYALRVVQQPAVEPISLEEARQHLRIDASNGPDDTWLEYIGIRGARDWCEVYMERSIAQKTLELASNAFDAAGSGIVLPLGPVASVLSIGYIDEDGIEQVFEDFELDNYSDPPVLNTAYGASWPAARATMNAVKVRYRAGYTLPGDSPNDNPLPPAIRAAVLLVLGHLYSNRENTTTGRYPAIEVPLGAKDLLRAYTLRRSMA